MDDISGGVFGGGATNRVRSLRIAESDIILFFNDMSLAFNVFIRSKKFDVNVRTLYSRLTP